jgi:hypothetical protein
MRQFVNIAVFLSAALLLFLGFQNCSGMSAASMSGNGGGYAGLHVDPLGTPGSPGADQFPDVAPPQTVGPNSNLVPIYRGHLASGDENFSSRVSELSAYSAVGPAFNLSTAGGRTIYRCYDAPNADHFLSYSSGCEGRLVEALIGYASSTSGGGLLPLTRCYIGNHHLETTNAADCATGSAQVLLGYVTAI